MRLAYIRPLAGVGRQALHCTTYMAGALWSLAIKRDISPPARVGAGDGWFPQGGSQSNKSPL